LDRELQASIILGTIPENKKKNKKKKQSYKKARWQWREKLPP
jgi:hypothetical protein